MWSASSRKMRRERHFWGVIAKSPGLWSDVCQGKTEGGWEVVWPLLYGLHSPTFGSDRPPPMRWRRTSVSSPCVQQPQAGPACTWSFRAVAGTLLTIQLRCRRPGSILLTCFLPASGDRSANRSKMPVRVSKWASNTPGVGGVSGESSGTVYSLAFLIHVPSGDDSFL